MPLYQLTHLTADMLIVCSLCVAALLMWQILHYCFRRGGRSRLRLPELTAYIREPAMNAGDHLQVFVHTTLTAQVTLFRMGRELQPIDWSRTLAPQVQSAIYSRWRGCDWQASFELDTAGLLPGMYILCFQQTDHAPACFRLVFLLRSSEPVDVAVIASTNTWNAYNAFGGMSNYRDASTPLPLRWVALAFSALNLKMVVGDRRHFPCVPLPWCRPNPELDEDLRDPQECPTRRASHLARAEWPLLRFLEQRSVNYGVFSDLDFESDHRITSAGLVIFNTHSEYWSEEMEGRLRSWLDAGGKTLFLSGNNLYRRVKVLEDALEVYDFRTDRDAVAAAIGAGYDANGYTTYAGYRVVTANHWAFEGLNVAAGDVFGGRSKSENVNPLDPASGASGYETDKVTSASRDTTILAIGENPSGPAHLVCKTMPNGGWVVNCGSVAVGAWLLKDKVLAGLVENVIRQAAPDTREDSYRLQG